MINRSDFVIQCSTVLPYMLPALHRVSLTGSIQVPNVILLRSPGFLTRVDIDRIVLMRKLSKGL